MVNWEETVGVWGSTSVSPGDFAGGEIRGQSNVA
jgi:hypothetical protein